MYTISKDKLRAAIQSILPPELGDDIRNNIDAVIRSNLGKMNLVTREQFEIQEKILKRTRERLSELENRVKELEEKM